MSAALPPPSGHFDWLEESLLLEGQRLSARFQRAELRPAVKRLLEAYREHDLRTHLSVGWSDVVPVAVETGKMLSEPDFSKGEPFLNRRLDLTTTLEVAAAQADLLSRTGCLAQHCTYKDRVLVADGALEQDRVVLHRHGDARDGNSGWYLGPVEGEAIQKVDGFERLMSASLWSRRPTLVAALALPHGTRVLFCGETITEIRDRHNTLLYQPNNRA